MCISQIGDCGLMIMSLEIFEEHNGLRSRTVDSVGPHQISFDNIWQSSKYLELGHFQTPGCLSSIFVIDDNDDDDNDVNENGGTGDPLCC